MKNKENAFSLAELLISLLVTSMILAATIPTITRKNAQSNDIPVKYFNDSTNVITTWADSQSLFLGSPRTSGGGIYRII